MNEAMGPTVVLEHVSHVASATTRPARATQHDPSRPKRNLSLRFTGTPSPRRPQIDERKPRNVRWPNR